MTSPPTAATRVVALLGTPVSHSLSPVFQNAALRAAGLDGVYVALRCDSAAFPGLLRGIARAGGAGNVTVPHKEAAVLAVDRRTPAVERTGACNAFWLEDGEVWGDNTDVAGFTAAAGALLGREPGGARVLLAGAGGAARAVLCALADSGAEEVVVLNRTPGRAEALASAFRGVGPRLVVATSAAELAGERFDLAVNSTALGLKPGDPHPLVLDGGPRFDAALDLVYAPDETPWVRAARERGVPAADGLEMLLRQGAAAFERWWGIPAPLDAMRAALPPRGRPA
ncbi:MAG TPA: shikimate dehydrogenase [Longimicrobiaceae bacterium]|nr:shikimate dehydrogenase [Longimicrobiaceae bacterium]